MSWLRKIFGLQSSQETKVYCEKDTQTVKDGNESKITESNFEELKEDENKNDDVKMTVKRMQKLVFT